MGKRGPRPTPTAELELRGSRQAAINKKNNEPQPELGAPDPPAWLEGEGLEVWNELAPQLVEMGVFTKVDGLAFARYCVLWAQWVKATMFVQKHGTTYPLKDGNGKIKCFAQFPEVAVMNKTSLTLSRLEAEFGLTPSARTRISVQVKPAPRSNDPKEEFDFGGFKIEAYAKKNA